MKLYLAVPLISLVAGITVAAIQGERLRRLLKRYPAPVLCNERPVVYSPPVETYQFKETQGCRPGTCYPPNNAVKNDLVLNFLDQSADPCEDFNKYACGGWNFNNVIPPDREEYTIFDTMSDKVTRKIEEIFASRDFQNHPSKSLRNSAELYYGCMDKDTRKKVGLEPLRRLLSQLGGWPLLHGNNANINGSWMEMGVNIRLRTGLGTMMNIHVAANPTNTKKKVISIGYPLNVMELRDWHLKVRRATPIEWIEGYKRLIREIAILLGAKDTHDLYRDATDITHFESTLLRVKGGHDDAKMASVGELMQKYPKIDWTYLFKNLFDINAKEEKDLKVLVENSAYLEYLSNHLQAVPFRTVSNYMLWSVVLHLASETNEEMRETIFAYSKRIYGTRQKKTLKTLCSSAIETFMPIPISTIYIRENFPESNKKEVENILKEIHLAFKESIKSNDWMDDSTKKIAYEKLEVMISVIGYPQWIFDPEEVEAIYEGVGDLDRNKFFDSIQQVKAALSKNKLIQWNDSNHRMDASYNLGNPLMVNAFYSVWANAIFYPAALLEYPIYRSEAPIAMNFGSLGSILGHELTHAFDEDGSVVGPEGNYLDWWTPDSKKNFERKLKCFIEQYNRYVDFNNSKASGQITLNDNLADNGGVRTSYKAFKSYMAKNQHLIPLQRIPGLNSTADQLFFLAYGTVWCGKSRKEFEKSKSGQSTHSPSTMRVIGTMSNMKEFADAFKCKEGAKLNPSKKCILW